MSQALAQSWQSATADLAAAVARLRESVESRSPALTRVRVTAVESALKDATAAANAFVRSGAQVSDVQQSQWVGTLTQMGEVMRAAQNFLKEVPVQNGGAGALDAGFRIPGTQIVVPWAAALAVVAVVGVAWYATRRR